MNEITPNHHEIKPENDKEFRLKRARQVTILGLALNLILAIIKIVISILFGSIALLADGLDSALDLATVIFGYLAMRISDKPADKDHQFGHEKFEYLFSLGIAVILVASSGIIAYQAIIKIINQTPLEFSIPNIIISVISIILKGFLVFVNITVGKKINSPILIANGKNFRTDILTSFAVLISVTISSLQINNFSLFWIDPIIAIIISIIIIVTAYTITKDSASVLLDQSPDPKVIDKISKVAKEVPGVIELRGIRARTVSSNRIIADLDIFVDPNITIMQGHEIVCQVEDEIKRKFPVKYLQIHMEPFHSHNKENKGTDEEDE